MKILCILLIACGPYLLPFNVCAQVESDTARLPVKGPGPDPGAAVKSGVEKIPGAVKGAVIDKIDNPGKTAAETAGGYVGGAVGGLPGKVIGSKIAGAAYTNIKEKGAPQKQADDAVNQAQHPDMKGPDTSRPYFDDKGNVHYPDKNQKFVKDPNTGRMVVKWKSPDEVAKDAAKQAAQDAAKDTAKDAAKDAAKQAAQNTAKEVTRPPTVGGGGGGGGGCGGPCGR